MKWLGGVVAIAFLVGCTEKICNCPSFSVPSTLADAEAETELYLCPAHEQSCDGVTIVTSDYNTATNVDWTIVYDGSDGAPVYAESPGPVGACPCSTLIGPADYRVPACSTPSLLLPACGSNE